MQYWQELMEKMEGRESLTLIRDYAVNFYKSHSLSECFDTAMELCEFELYQFQEAGIFILGYISADSEKALEFLQNTVSRNTDWRIQEVLAMAFDSFCKERGYEKSLPTIEQWLNSSNANNRRAVTEGLRVWTNRPYFRDKPQKAIDILSAHKNDESEFVRKSVGNALRDISKKFPELIEKELESWDTSSKEVMSVHKIANKFLAANAK